MQASYVNVPNSLGQCGSSAGYQTPSVAPKMETLYDVSQVTAKMTDELVSGLERLYQHFSPNPECQPQQPAPSSGHMSLAIYSRGRLEDAGRILRNILDLVGA